MTRVSGKAAAPDKDCAITIGKFESIHTGHKYLIEETRRRALSRGLSSAVATFDPHPRKVLSDPGYKPLFTREERALLLRGADIDYLLELPFDRDFAAIAPEDFCGILFGRLRGRVLVVGENYRFGRDRAGTPETLKRAAGAYDAEVVVLPHHITEVPGASSRQKVSTSDIRGLIGRHMLEEAGSLLGFYFFVLGAVEHGRKIGRTLGFPTVNIKPEPDKFLPPNGVYATRTNHNGRVYKSVTNIGVRPTVGGGYLGERLIESFLLGFEGDLYGETLLTEFISFIRPERRFGDITSLREQIRQDIMAASE